MVDSIAASTSIIAHDLLRRGSFTKFRSFAKISGRRPASSCNLRLPMAKFSVKSLATEIAKERSHSSRDDRLLQGLSFMADTGLSPEQLWPPPNTADNPSLHNPLLRRDRMGCGWLGVIFELEGVVIEADPDLEKKAWLALAREEGKSPPPAFILKRIQGMKNEQAISEVLCWSRDLSELQRLSLQREAIYRSLQGGYYQLRSGSQEFITTLVNYNVPMAVASTRPRKAVEEAMAEVGLEGYFVAVVAAEDVHRGKPDPEMFLYVAQLLGFIPERCIVFGCMNSTVEAAHDSKMKCIAVASKHPVYELSAADLVVRRLDELSIVDLKNLSDIDSPEFGSLEPEFEMEMEEDTNPSSAAVDDLFW